MKRNNTIGTYTLKQIEALTKSKNISHLPRDVQDAIETYRKYGIEK